MRAMKNRLIFMTGAAVGATVGIGTALRASGLVQRSVRDEFQQSLEALLFRALDMTPFTPQPVDVVTEIRPASTPLAYTPAADIVLNSRPGESGTGAHA
jgi:hypothetical protein